MDHTGDLLLFQRIRQDDRLALNTLFAQYYQKLCRFACSCSLTHEQAEEVVSDVFFMIWKDRARMNIRQRVKAYLYTCVRHAALSVLRQQQPAVSLSAEHDQADVNTPEMHILYDELYNHVQHAIDKLPARCRQIFMMNRLDGLKYKEIASILGISERTVEHQLARALERVRFSLQRKPEYDLHNSITVS